MGDNRTEDTAVVVAGTNGKPAIWKVGTSTMLLREAETAALAAAVLEEGSMKLSGVASWPAAEEKLGAMVPFPSGCACIWSCCGVNLSF